MNKFIGLCFGMLICFLATAQMPTTPGAGNRGGMGNGQMPTGRFYGKIIDAKTGKPVEYASVELFQNKMDTVTKKRKETVISGMLTKTNGEFSLKIFRRLDNQNLK